MHSIIANKKHAIVTVTLAIHGSITDPGEIADGLNELLQPALESNLLADYSFLNIDEPKFVISSDYPEEGELFS